MTRLSVRWPKARSARRLLTLTAATLLIAWGEPGHSLQSAAKPATAATSGHVKRPPARSFAIHLPAKAIAYQRDGYWMLFVGMPWSFGGLLLFLVSGASARLRTAIYAALHTSAPQEGQPPRLLPLALFYAGFTLALTAWSLPLTLASIHIERAYGFSRESNLGILRDSALDFVLQLVWAPVLWLAYRVYNRLGARWWLTLWAILTPLVVLSTLIQPVLIAPLFNHYTPLPSGDLRTQIERLERRAGITGAELLVENTSKRTTHVNAYVTGLGPSARIVINDTAVHELPEGEVLAMVGHEMGHYVEGHVWVETASQVAGLGVFLWLADMLLPALERRLRGWAHTRSILDMAALPVISLTISLFLWVQQPVANLESRYLEHRADAFGLRLTHRNNDMARLFVGFAERDYDDPNPPALIRFWFYSHPPLDERIRFALEYNDAAGSSAN
ncbi:MAG: M48 family metallopeptidase [Armatimonadetes bacterium]|nr:M48 family metallopeptidase [Armatimonadota bacterium]MDE2206391.1 M48 family metallopeptidase [Armatimonadota bacterium]